MFYETEVSMHDGVLFAEKVNTNSDTNTPQAKEIEVLLLSNRTPHLAYGLVLHINKKNHIYRIHRVSSKDAI